ncbi:conserved hypothetical protein [Leishmania mexicana MHOM/GT/2001/U1103]|uniref:Uncharacterized protein n=1 Tax=Leishmania mexicana (strain MHOM/GT/2001/U1103) TaxID=929439 RepID=E9AZ97_LEIMU|nr:conserved hypothetical protein [Leishmania mexicana MHOM/GT/2001/U1103]CBZ28297.1 conserved hypothetical protein [Leishmania mexicana MHOM/GT/2001/U1103]
MLFGNEPPFHLKPIPYRGVRKHQAEVLQHPPGYKHPIIPLPLCSEPEVTATRPGASSTAAHLSRSSAFLSPGPSVNSRSTPGTSPCTSSNHRAVGPATASALHRVGPPNLLQQQQHNPRMRRDSGRGGDAFLADAERLDPDMTADAALRQERVRERQKLRGHQQARRERAASREATLQASRNAAFEAECRRLANVAGTARSNREQDDRDPITHQCYTAEAEKLVMDRNCDVRTRYAARQRFLDRQMNSTEYNILTWQLR